MAMREFDATRIGSNMTSTSIPWRSASAFIPSHSDHTDAIITLLKDHRQVSHLLEQLLDLSKKQDKSVSQEKRRILEDMIKQLSIHSHIEELHVYPLIRTHIKNGDSLIDRSLSEHLEVKQHLHDLDRFSGTLGTNPDTWPPFPVVKIEALRTALMQHIREAEEQIFPEFRKSMSEKDLLTLGAKLENARSQVPTRPHPSAPDAPPFMNVAGPVAAAFDRAKDVYRDVKERVTGGAPPPM